MHRAYYAEVLGWSTRCNAPPHVTDRLPNPTRTLPSSLFPLPFSLSNPAIPKRVTRSGILRFPSPLGRTSTLLLYRFDFLPSLCKMADMATVADEKLSPNHEDMQQPLNGADTRGNRRGRTSAEDDEDDEDKPGRERRKIEIKFIQDKSRRHITFSKRKAGIMKKVRFCSFACYQSAPVSPLARLVHSTRAVGLTSMHQAYELSVLTGTQVLLLVVSETGLVYTFTTPKLQPLVTKAEGKNLIQVRSFFPLENLGRMKLILRFQACLNAPDPTTTENGVEGPDVPPEAPEDVAHNAPQGSMPRPGIHPGYMTNEQQQQMAYYQNLQQQQAGGQYPGMPVGTRMPPQHQPTA